MRTKIVYSGELEVRMYWCGIVHTVPAPLVRTQEMHKCKGLKPTEIYWSTRAPMVKKLEMTQSCLDDAIRYQEHATRRVATQKAVNTKLKNKIKREYAK